ncbi:hypothetical protein QBC47DRAFT_380386 [Echria macrotheca]|uniref:Uncharacterized protein n=1 Tax=Echria macrotheca TaxID=438768 RepID=A0AAJ0BBX7_9PEZI|nr:hypothetical protein QBC47DRAFT_380386 [Echria macrotheca]
MRVMRRVPTLRKKLADPERSCGREILTTRVPRSKRVWWCCGAAMEKFEAEIAPKIDDQLRNVDLGYADIFVRLYMVGSRANNSRPIIMVCCTDTAVRTNAETEIRRSGLLNEFPEFGIGQSALPLEQPTAARALVGEKPNVYIQTNKQNEELSFEIGCSLVFVGQHGRYHATGGAILTIENYAYQLTVGHIGETTEAPDSSSAMPASQDLDECRFDGMSDDENSGQDSETDTLDATSRGSRTPENEEGSWRLDSLSGVEDSETSTSRASSPQLSRSEPPQLLKQAEITQPTTVTHAASVTHKSPVMTHVLDITALVDRASGGPNPGLDYALVPLGPVASSQLKTKNEVYIREPEEKTVHVQEVAEVKTSENRIIAVTAFGGPSRGVIIPGATFFRGHGRRSFQKLYAIQLENTHVYEGDCGSVVIGEETGELYGHIVSGCPGTPIAYMVPATEVFADLSARLKTPVSLALPTSQVPDIKARRPSPEIENRLRASLEKTNLAAEEPVTKITSSRFQGKKLSHVSDRDAMSMIEAEQALMDKEELSNPRLSSISKGKTSRPPRRRDSGQFGYISSSSTTDTGASSSSSSRWEGRGRFSYVEPLGPAARPPPALEGKDEIRNAIAEKVAAKERWMARATELEDLLGQANKTLKESKARLQALEDHADELVGEISQAKKNNDRLRMVNMSLRGGLSDKGVDAPREDSQMDMVKPRRQLNRLENQGGG